jgi:hypothetical protein
LILAGDFTPCTDCRSFGVLLWEIVSYGRTPLDDVVMEDIVNAAQECTLCHARSEFMMVYYYYTLCHFIIVSLLFL